jgi:hypothetical protein
METWGAKALAVLSGSGGMSSRRDMFKHKPEHKEEKLKLKRTECQSFACLISIAPEQGEEVCDEKLCFRAVARGRSFGVLGDPLDRGMTVARQSCPRITITWTLAVPENSFLVLCSTFVRSIVFSCGATIWHPITPSLGDIEQKGGHNCHLLFPLNNNIPLPSRQRES